MRAQITSLVTDVSNASLALVANVGRRNSGNRSEFGEMIRRRSSGGASNANKADLATIEAKMTEIYRLHLPSKVNDVPQLLLKYQGREHEMLRKLEDRFGPAPEPKKGSPLAAMFAPAHSTAVEKSLIGNNLDKNKHRFDKLVDLSNLGESKKQETSEQSLVPSQSRFLSDPFAGLGNTMRKK